MSANPEASIPLSDDVESYVRERVELEVSSVVPIAVSREEERRFRQLKWLIALVGLVGLSTFGTLSNYLIEKAVDSRLEARTGNISDSLDFIRFNSIALKLDLGTSFSKEDRHAAMTYLRRTAKNDRVRYTPEFNAALVQVMESFVGAGQSSSIDEIFQLYERELLTTDTLVEILLHHYGQELVARTTDPNSDDFPLKVFERLEAVAAGAEVAELAQTYRVLREHRRSPETFQRSVVDLLSFAEMNNTDDLARFYREVLLRTRATNWQRIPDAQGLAFQTVTRSFFSVYSAEISRRASIDRGFFQRVSADGVEESMADDVAKKIAHGIKKSALPT